MKGYGSFLVGLLTSYVEKECYIFWGPVILKIRGFRTVETIPK